MSNGNHRRLSFFAAAALLGACGSGGGDAGPAADAANGGAQPTVDQGQGGSGGGSANDAAAPQPDAAAPQPDARTPDAGAPPDAAIPDARTATDGPAPTPDQGEPPADVAVPLPDAPLSPSDLGAGGALPPPEPDLGAGGVEPPVEGCLGDPVCPPAPPPVALCDAEPCTWAVPDPWSPAGRVTHLNVPSSAVCAQQAGCSLVGPGNGAALAGILPLLSPEAPLPGPGACPGDVLTTLLRPNDQGVIAFPWLTHLRGVDDGEAFGETGPVDVQFLTGVAGADADHWGIAPESFVAGTEEALVHFSPSTIAADGRLTTPRGKFAVTLPMTSLPLYLSLEAARMSGYVTIGPGGVGHAVEHGLVAGYLTHKSIIEMVMAIDARCAAPGPPASCGVIAGLVPPGTCTPDACEAGLGLFSSFLGGFEARVDEQGEAVDCLAQAPGDCNAIGVCFELTVEPTQIVP